MTGCVSGSYSGAHRSLNEQRLREEVEDLVVTYGVSTLFLQCVIESGGSV